MFAESGAAMPRGVGTGTPKQVTDAVVRAITRKVAPRFSGWTVGTRSLVRMSPTSGGFREGHPPPKLPPEGSRDPANSYTMPPGLGPSC